VAATAKYLYVGIIVLAASGAVAIYLNFQGVKCLTDLARLDRSVAPPNLIGERERNCAITTNSYVYSIYGVIAGVILVVIGFMRKRRDNAS
jgi:hypothetical protein